MRKLNGRDIPPGIVTIHRPSLGDQIERPAAFVYYSEPEGLVWLEPNYLDPWNAAPAMRTMVGVVSRAGDTLEVRQGDVLIGRYAPAQDVRWPDAMRADISKAGRDPASEWDFLIQWALVDEVLDSAIQDDQADRAAG